MVLSKTSYFTIEMQDHVIFAYFHGAFSLKRIFSGADALFYTKPWQLLSFKKHPA